jgi:hypothetical protein
MAEDAQTRLFREFCAEVMRYQHNPLGFVRVIYPWGQGTLQDSAGPRDWHVDVLTDIGTRLRRGLEPGAAMMPVLKAVGSGHGIGKSSLLAWLGWWALSTCPHTKVRTTANTKTQLVSTSVPEAAKWAALARNRDWFKVDGTQIVASDPRHRLTWRWDFVTWSESNTEAFAGLHNKGRRIVMLFDEASGIVGKVWEPAEGILTDEATEILWLVVGNPTQPEGRFFECFNKERGRWHPVQIDSRTVEGTNKALLDEWVAAYGEDSDFVRVRVRGQFPRAGSTQFIAHDVIEMAATQAASGIPTDPLILGVDVARFGDDASVLAPRKGRDARILPWETYRGLDNMQLAARVAEFCTRHSVDAVFVDEGGTGSGVVDRCRQLNVPVTGVQFGGKPWRAQTDRDATKYKNRRAEMWGVMRAWLPGGGIPNDPELITDLGGVQYMFDANNAIQLERKEDMKRRGLSSPDKGDALALTFAEDVLPASVGGLYGTRSRGVQSEYDVFA